MAVGELCKACEKRRRETGSRRQIKDEQPECPRSEQLVGCAACGSGLWRLYYR